MRPAIRLLSLATLALLPRHASPRALELDHLWIVVSPGAPERAALQRAGFVVWPAVQRHVGQGTASVMVELDRGFIELIWPDSTVPVAGGGEAAARRFAQRARWRTSAWAPVGIGLRRTPAAPDSLPYDSWPLAAAWRAPGDVPRMITARADSASPSVWVVARSTAAGNDEAPAAARAHPNGARRITALALTVPRGAPDTDALRALRDAGLTVARGDDWLVTVTLDSLRQRRSRDLRPELPLVVRW